MTPSGYKRCFLVTALVLLAALPWLVLGTLRATAPTANSPLDWMPLTFAARADYEHFRQRFENGDVVIAAWPGCTLDDPRLTAFADALRASSQAVAPTGEPYFDRIIDGRQVLNQLASEPLKLSRAEIVERLRSSLVGSDGNRSCCVIVFTLAGVRERAAAVELIQTTLATAGQVTRDDQHLVGPIIDGLNVDRASDESLKQFGLPTAALILLLGWWYLGSLRVAALVFGVAFYCVLATLALVDFCGDRVNAVLITMPTLVLVLGMSGGIHLVNYLYDSRQHGGLDNLASRAVALGWLPCALSAGTTAIGMGSLIVSTVLPVRQFGLYAAFGVSLTFVLLLLVLPGAFELWPTLSQRAVAIGNAADQSSERHGFWFDFWTLRTLVRQHPNFVAIASIAMMIAAAAGVPWIKASVRIQTLFDANQRILTDYDWIEKHVGPLVPIEVVINCDNSCTLDMLERLELLSDLEHRLRTLRFVGGTTSAVTFGPKLPSADQVARRAVARRLLNKHSDEFVNLRYLNRSGEGESWRVTARLSSLDDIDYGHFLDEVRSVIEPVLVQRRAAGITGLSAVYTGVMPLVHEVQRALLTDLFTSFLSAFAVITLVMCLVERGVLAGIVSMIPNVYPMVLLFGLFGWIGRPMDIGSVMTASIALGMAIDGTLHFLTFYRRGIRMGKDARGAVELAFDQCSRAMTQSSVVCGLGVLAFTASTFLPASRFAWMMLLLLWAALIGDLVVLPALLLGPCGKFFRARKLGGAESFATSAHVEGGSTHV